MYSQINTVNISYSIIIPVYNNSQYILKCINSIIEQEKSNYKYEILLIDDCSTDNTFEVLIKLIDKYSCIKLLQTPKNSGPGIARNIGINAASNKWILFLDSDDTLVQNTLKTLSDTIVSDPLSDVITYNWEYCNNSTAPLSKGGGRYDLYSLQKKRADLLHDYLSLGMDGSVIYTLMSTSLLKNNNVKFLEGFHEDVNFMFKVYYLATKISIVDKVLYIKNNRKDSIVNSISQKHIEGFFRSYEDIYKFLDKKNYLNKESLQSLYIGIVGIVASRAREIWFHKNNNNINSKLYCTLYTHLNNYIASYLKDEKLPNLNTRFFIIYKFFVELMKKKPTNLEEKMHSFLSVTLKKSWSCYDLHNSIFLAPGEIRTCCKRFFYKKKMKGDIVLLKNNITFDNILKAKKDLYTSINKGQAEECEGCPFLEFKEWGYIEDLKLEHMSFEYHSLCNMRCSYCSDKYYGGEKVQYNISKLVEELIDNGSLKNCKSIVWGGGEPTLDKEFITLLEKMVSTFPLVKQRIITNATLFKEKVLEYINEDKVTITTSIDAGTPETFYAIRKHKDFMSVFQNLKNYGKSKPENVTLKYIVMDQNREINEIKQFVSLVKEYQLQKCNFQISFDFKKDEIDIDSAVSMVVLFGLLTRINARLIFFDDLLLQRFKNMSQEKNSLIFNKLESLKLSSLLINKYNYPKLVIWGAGHQTRLLLESSKMLQEIQIICIADNDNNKIGTKYFGYDVVNPKFLQNNSYPIYISAVQNTPQILKQYEMLKLNKKRIVKGLLL